LSNGSTSFYEEYPIGFALNNMGDYNTIYLPENTGDFLALFPTCNIILLPESSSQFIKALELQWRIRLDKRYRHDHEYKCYICNPSVLYAFGSLLRANGDFSKYFPINCIDGDTITIDYNEYICKANWWENRVAEIESVAKSDNFNQIVSNSMLFLGGIYKMLKKTSGLVEPVLLLDGIEYKVFMILKKNKLIREVFDFISEDLCLVPCKRSVDIPYDLLIEHDVYLKIGDIEINMNHDIKEPLVDLNISDSMMVGLTLSIDSDKAINLDVRVANESYHYEIGSLPFIPK
jgi:hypothetical protein